ncbi:MAG: double zinc ribbon domain-containing protein, partial [bacterium]
MKLFKYLLNLIYPGQRHCLNCNQLLFKEELRGICINCLDKISFIDKYCEICGCQVEDKVVNVLEYNGFSKVFVCKDCRKDKSFN